jgi:hypothetical protein
MLNGFAPLAGVEIRWYFSGAPPDGVYRVRRTVQTDALGSVRTAFLVPLSTRFLTNLPGAHIVEAAEVGGSGRATTVFTIVCPDGETACADRVAGAEPTRVGCCPPVCKLLSWWRGEGNTIDQGPLGNDGQVVGDVSFGPGVIGQAFVFNNLAEPSYVQAPASGLPLGTSDRTLALWARIDEPIVLEAFFAAYGMPGIDGGAYILTATHLGTVETMIMFSQWGLEIVGVPLPVGEWHHLAATTAAGTSTLYVDGMPVGSADLPINTPPGGQVYLGRLPDDLGGGDRQLQGAVDEVAVYDRALSATEILWIVAGGHCA